MDLSLPVQDLATLGQVMLIDIALAGDNAVVVGLAVAGLPERQKRRAIIMGIGGATVIRIALGSIALQLLYIVGLLLAGGLLLLWVSWKMARDLRQRVPSHAVAPTRTLGQAMLRIILADVSMSLDNVLAVAGASHDRPWILATGLLLSVALMGIAADLLARVLERQRWIAWVGLLVVLYVALTMIWDGAHQVAHHIGA